MEEIKEEVIQSSIDKEPFWERFTIYIEPYRTAVFFFSVISFAILMEPSYITETQGVLHQIFRIGKYLFSVLILEIFLIRHAKLKWPLTGILAFEFLLLLSTLVHSGEIIKQMREAAYAIALVLLMQILLEIDATLLIDTLAIVFGGYVNLNIICRILYPNGMYQNNIGYKNCWLLGYDNPSVIFIVIAITIALYRISISCKKIRLWDWSILISGLAFILIQEIATAILVGLSCLILLVLLKNNWFRKTFGKGKYVCIGMFLLFFLIHFFNVQDQDFFSYIISLMGKNTTFTGRTWLWEKAWKKITGATIIFGNGFKTSNEYLKMFGKSFCVNLHSYYLQVLYEGGLLAFGTLFALIFYSASIYDRTERSYSSIIFLIGLFATMFMWQVEAYSAIIRYFFVILFLISNTQHIEESRSIREEPRVRFVFRK